MTDHYPASGAAVCWTIACDATLEQVLECAACPELFRRTVTGSMSWHVRNRTTIERVLTTPSAALYWFSALLALGAQVRVEGQGSIPVDAFLERRVKGHLQALHIPALAPDGALRPGIRWGEARVARTPSDEPIVLAIAVVEAAAGTVTRARLALTGVWARPAGLAGAADRLVGRGLDSGAIAEVVSAIGDEVAPRGDFLGSAEYRRAMAGVLARRALEACLQGQDGQEKDGEGGHGR